MNATPIDHAARPWLRNASAKAASQKTAIAATIAAPCGAMGRGFSRGETRRNAAASEGASMRGEDK